MRYTPVELRHVRLDRALFGGYKRADTDALLSDVADSFEDVWRERGELADRLEDVERHLDEVKQRETLLASTLIAAERTAAGFGTASICGRMSRTCADDRAAARAAGRSASDSVQSS